MFRIKTLVVQTYNDHVMMVKARPLISTQKGCKLTHLPLVDRLTMAEEKKDAYSPPPIQFCSLFKEEVIFFEGPLSGFSADAYTNNTIAKYANVTAKAVYSKDGDLYAVATTENILVFQSADRKNIQTLDMKGAREIYFSPLGKFLVGYDVLKKDGPENLFVFNVATGEVAQKFHCKNFLKDPVVQWTPNESLMGHLVSSEVQFYDGANPTQVIDRIKQKSIDHFSISPMGKDGNTVYVATFVPVHSSEAGKVCVYKVGDFSKPTIMRSFYKANSCQLLWNYLGASLLMFTQTDSSEAGYYGESGLYLVNSDGSLDVNVPFGNNKGEVHYVAWSPRTHEFITLQGESRAARAILWSAVKCTPLKEFGCGPWNTVRFSPHGRFVALGGFGNLAGEIEFWDKNKLVKLGVCQDRNGAKSYQWSPCGRFFITASLRPWRNVDNGFKVWTYYGELVHDQKIDILYDVSIRPAVSGVYKDMVASPRLTDRSLSQTNVQKQLAAKPSAYVPPHLRAMGQGPSDFMKKEQGLDQLTGPRNLAKLQKQLERQQIIGEQQQQKLAAQPTKPPLRYVPGLSNQELVHTPPPGMGRTQPPQFQQQSQQQQGLPGQDQGEEKQEGKARRRRRKGGSNATRDGDGDGDGSGNDDDADTKKTSSSGGNNNNTNNNNQKGNRKSGANNKDEDDFPALGGNGKGQAKQEDGEDEESGLGALERKVRNLRKKMRSFDSLKEKFASGAELSKEERFKMDKEKATARELSTLEELLKQATLNAGGVKK